MFRRFSLLGSAALLLAGFFSLSPAQAVPPVTVNFGISAGAYAPTGVACPVSVAAGANGLAVLDAAVAKGCIRSYKAETYSFGAFVSCINEVCGAPPAALYLTYWEMSENGKCTEDYGVSGFRADDGDELTFAYTTWAKFLAVGC